MHNLGKLEKRSPVLSEELLDLAALLAGIDQLLLESHPTTLIARSLVCHVTLLPYPT